MQDKIFPVKNDKELQDCAANCINHESG